MQLLWQERMWFILHKSFWTVHIMKKQGVFTYMSVLWYSLKERFSVWDFKFSRQQVWCPELSSGIYCRVKRRQSFYTAIYPRRQLWTYFLYFFKMATFRIHLTIFIKEHYMVNKKTQFNSQYNTYQYTPVSFAVDVQESMLLFRVCN
jgi:hypothetical protein